jgi:prephenate dehydrogenase
MTKTIAIVGLGLIGGSMALALQKQGGYTVLGFDRDPATQEAALASGAVQDTAGPETLPQAELLILALPPEAAVACLRELGDFLRPGALVTDVCGVKRAVVGACGPLCREKGLLFLGGHPMAGRERGGFQNATGNLFRGASYILTPTPDTPETAVASMKQLAADLGCGGVTVASPEEHDRMIAFTSQLPHVLAGAYVQSPQCPDHRGYSAGSYRDVSRVAAVDETLWSQLFLMNRDMLCGELDGLIQRLQTARAAVASGDREAVAEVIRRGRLVKERLGE